MSAGLPTPTPAHSRKRATTSAIWPTATCRTGWVAGVDRFSAIFPAPLRSPRDIWQQRTSSIKGKFDHHRHVVGGLFPAAYVAIDGGRRQPVGGLRREQDVVDPDAVVFLPGPSLVVPERVEARLVAAGADRVGQPKIA